MKRRIFFNLVLVAGLLCVPCLSPMEYGDTSPQQHLDSIFDGQCFYKGEGCPQFSPRQIQYYLQHMFDAPPIFDTPPNEFEPTTMPTFLVQQPEQLEAGANHLSDVQLPYQTENSTTQTLEQKQFTPLQGQDDFLQQPLGSQHLVVAEGTVGHGQKRKRPESDEQENQQQSKRIRRESPQVPLTEHNSSRILVPNQQLEDQASENFFAQPDDELKALWQNDTAQLELQDMQNMFPYELQNETIFQPISASLSTTFPNQRSERLPVPSPSVSPVHLAPHEQTAEMTTLLEQLGHIENDTPFFIDRAIDFVDHLFQRNYNIPLPERERFREFINSAMRVFDVRTEDIFTTLTYLQRCFGFEPNFQNICAVFLASLFVTRKLTDDCPPLKRTMINRAPAFLYAYGVTDFNFRDIEKNILKCLDYQIDPLALLNIGSQNEPGLTTSKARRLLRRIARLNL